MVASTVSVYGEAGHSHRRSTAAEPLADEERFAVDYRRLEPVREAALDVSGQSWEYRDEVDEYGEGKRMMERVMLESPADWPWIVVRVPATLGPADPSGRFAWWLTRILDGGPILLPDGGVHAVQVGFSEDLARFLGAAPGGRTAAQHLQLRPGRVAVPGQLAADHGRGRRPAAADRLRPLGGPGAPLGPAVEGVVLRPLQLLPAADEPSTGPRPTSAWTSASPGVEWTRRTVEWYAADPGRLSTAKHGEERPAEIRFAEGWSRVLEDLGRQLRV